MLKEEKIQMLVDVDYEQTLLASLIDEAPTESERKFWANRMEELLEWALKIVNKFPRPEKTEA